MEPCPASDVRLERLAHAAYGWCSQAICAVGVVANLANLLVLRRPPLRALTVYTYLLWLSVADLFGLCFCSVFAYLLSQESAHPCTGAPLALAFYAAHLNKPLTNTCLASGVWITFWLSANRRVAVTRPTSYLAEETGDVAFLRIACTLAVSMTLFMPMVFQSQVELDEEIGGYVLRQEAFTYTTAWMVYQWLLQVVVRLLPAAGILINNVLVVRGLAARAGVQVFPAPAAWRRCCCSRPTTQVAPPPVIELVESSVYGTGASDGSSPRQRRRASGHRLRAAYMLPAISALTIISNVFSALLFVWAAQGKMKLAKGYTSYQVWRAVGNNLELFTLAANPFLNILFSREIRSGYRRLLLEHKRCRRSD
ncbi:probable G-protein coupled receptor B0563.6 [Amphibalanus amphitrite]|uniref:probable G-protein coupled receptor B0563.6 n=1 Tax=Amphibalanus amphitrite TaxID=1232801 RepID=UPI001C90A74C|nr:probable G-protein coupled receptor B0563.6 [Amphibalanus amphitrite]